MNAPAPNYIALKHPWWVILVTLIIIVIAGYGASRLKPTSDYRIFFSEDNPQLKAFEELQDKYTKNDNILFVVASKSDNIFTKDNLISIKSLTKQSWLTPYSVRVDSIANYQHSYGEDDDLIIENLIPKASKLSTEKISSIRAIALSEPLLVNRLISPTGNVAGVNVSTSLPPDPSVAQIQEISGHAYRLIEEIEAQNPDLKIYLTGVKMMDQAFIDASINDATLLFPAMFAVVVILIGLFFRSLLSVFYTLLIIVLSIITTMGIGGWLGIRLSTPVMSVPTILLTLAVADCIHLYTIFFIQRRSGSEKFAALRDSLTSNYKPMLITSVTTGLGFLTMNFSDSPPFRDLGNLVAMGALIAFALSIYLLPALITVTPQKRIPQPLNLTARMALFAEFVTSRYKLLLITMTTLTILLALAITKNELNDEFVKYFDETSPFRIATDFASDNLTGLYMFEYDINSQIPEGMHVPGFLQHVDDFVQWARTLPEAKHVNNFTDILKRINQNLNEGQKDWYKLPTSEEMSAQYTLLYELSLPRGLDLNNQIDMFKSSTRVTITTNNLSTKKMLAFEEKTYQWMKKHWPESLWVHGTGSTMMFAHISKRNIKSMLTGTVIGLILISGLLIIIFKSVKLGLISLVPNLTPPIFAFGVWGLMVGNVGLGLASVMGMVLGIIVDDTVHFLSKYQQAKQKNALSSKDAVHYAFTNVGPALFTTTVVLTAGFLILALSSFALTADLGLLTACAIVFALVTDFLLLAPLLLWLDRE